MPLYAAASDIFGQAGYHLTTTVIASATINKYIDKAEGYIHSRVAKKYTVPFTSTAIPQLIKDLTIDIAGYYTLSYLHQQGNRNFISDQVRLMYDDAKDILGQIYSGEAILYATGTSGNLEEVTQRVNGTLKATYNNIPPIVNMDSEYSWGVSGQLKDDIEFRRDAAE